MMVVGTDYMLRKPHLLKPIIVDSNTRLNDEYHQLVCYFL